MDTTTYRLDGHTVRAYRLGVPLDHATAGGEQITVFAREIIRDGGEQRPRLLWLQGAMRQAARAGLDMNEVLALPLPAEFAELPVANSEYRRSVGHLFPAAELEALK